MIATMTFRGLPLGINQAVPPQEIPDGAARWIQDALLDKAGEVRMRGPLATSSDISASITDRPQGLVQLLTDAGALRVAVLGGTTTPRLNFLNSALSSSTALNFGSQSWSTPPIWQARAALKGGTYIGTAQAPTPTAAGVLGLWRGSTKADYTTGTITATRGSRTVTGSGTSWTANVEPGMFLFKTASAGGAGQRTLIGTVATVDSNTQVTLKHNALASAAAASNYLLTSVRGTSVRVGKGRITTSTVDTTVLGAGTKFQMMNVLGETWDLYRASDLTWVGTVSSVTNDRALKLSANAAIAMANETYLAIRLAPSNNFSVTPSSATGGLGFLTTTYAGLQFYANLLLPSSVDSKATSELMSRVWFSELHDGEAVDMSPADGDFFNVASQAGGNTPIMAIVGLQNALAILKETELFAVYGTDSSSFQLRKIADVGTVSPMSVVQYKNGIIFAGREGIYYFDGTSVQELSKSLGTFYRDSIVGFNSATDRAYGALFRNHYLLSLTDFVSSYSPTRGSQGTSITKGTLVINLDTGGITWFTNVQFKGWVNLPASTGFDAWFAVVNSSDSSTKLCDANQLWTGLGPDLVTCSGETAGPSFYVETKKYDVKDPERLKTFRQLAMHYSLQGDTLSMDVVNGLQEIGRTTRNPWQVQTDMLNKRLQFQARDTHVGFRLYPTNNTASTIVIGPYAIGFKLQRVGRT